MLITAEFGSVNTGADMRYTVYNVDKSVYQARTAVGVTELVAGTGLYGVQVADAILAGRMVVWDIEGTTKAASEWFPLDLVDTPAILAMATGTDTVADLILATVDGLGTAGGAAINIDPYGDNSAGGIPGVTVATTKVGTQTGAFANVSNVNAVYHTITHAGNAIDWVYEFRCGGGTTPVNVVWTGYLVSANDTVMVDAWSYRTNGWVNIGTIVGQSGTANIVRNFTLYPRHIGGIGPELGKVYIRFRCTGMTSPVLNTDQLYVSYSVTSRSIGYADGCIWIDTLTGVAGSEPYVNGTADNPCLTYADAELLEEALSISRFHVNNGSTLNVDGHVNDLVAHTFYGENWHLNLTNDVDISNAYIEGANIIGTAVSPNGDAVFESCHFENVTCGPMTATNSRFAGTFAMSVGYYAMLNCGAQHPTIEPTFDFGAGGVGAMLALRAWTGGIICSNMTDGDHLILGGWGKVTFQVDCDGGNASIRGNVELHDDSTAPGVTIIDSSRYSTDQAVAHVEDAVAPLNDSITAILTDSDELQLAWTEGGRLDLLLDALEANVSLLRKMRTNKTDEDAIAGGIQVTYYDDNDTTPLGSQEFTDADGVRTKLA
jgi:hypothetical protein